MRGRFFLALVIVVTAISIGCGSGGGSQNVPAGQLGVFPSTFNFGEVAVGQRATKTGTLKTGNAPITVTSAEWKGEGYSVSGIAFPITIAAGKSISFKVTFAPQTSGKSLGSLSFLSDATNSPHAEALNADGTQLGAHTVTLSWQPATGNVAGYNIYRTTNNGTYARINSAIQPDATFTDATVQDGLTYFYATTAVDQQGTESKFSNQVQVTIPSS